MSSGDPWSLSSGPRDWPSAAPRLDEHVVEAVRAELPGMALAVVSEIQHQVEEYADPFRGEMGRTIQNAVGLALGESPADDALVGAEVGSGSGSSPDEQAVSSATASRAVDRTGASPVVVRVIGSSSPSRPSGGCRRPTRARGTR